MDYSRSDRIALAALLSIGGALSIIGSALIIYMEISQRKEGPVRSRRPTYHRFLLAMSVYKIMQGIWATIGTIAVPKESGGYGSFGNSGTCTAQGFFTTMSLSELIYNAGLSIYYVSVIRYGWKDQMVSQRIEPIVHLLAFVEPMMFGISGLYLTVYNAPFIPELGCWASPKPLTCYFTNEACERGRYFSEWSWAFYSQQCLYVAIVMVMSAVLFWTIRKQYRAQSRYASRESIQMKERSREVAFQALLFAAACLYTNMWSIIVTLNYLFGASPLWNKIAVYNGVPAFTSQGFLNFLVYIRPRYVRYRRKRPEVGRWGALVEVVFGDQSNTRRSISYGSENGTKGSMQRLSVFRRSSMTKMGAALTISPTKGGRHQGTTVQQCDILAAIQDVREEFADDEFIDNEICPQDCARSTDGDTKDESVDSN